MIFEASIANLRPNDPETQILDAIFGDQTWPPDVLSESNRVYLDEDRTGVGVTPVDILRFLRRQSLEPKVRQECYYCIETLPVELVALAARCWQETYVERDVKWNEEGF